MLGRSVWSVAITVGLLACGGNERPPAIDLNPALNTGGAPDDPGGGGDPGGDEPASNDLRKGGFLDIPQVSDIAYDDARGVLYVSSTQGVLVTVDVATGDIIDTMKVGEGPLLGLDLSPSGSRLAIGELTVDLDKMEYWVHVLDFAERSRFEVRLPLRYDLQEGVHAMAFADDDTLYLSSSFKAGGYVPLIRADLRDGSFEALNEVYSDAFFARSRDDTTIVVASPHDGKGPFFTIGTAALTVAEEFAYADLHQVALNADASKVAFPVANEVKILSRDETNAYTAEVTLAEPDRNALAAVFSPDSASLFVTWSNKADNSPPFVARYDVETLERRGVLQTGIKLAFSRLGDFEPTRMRITDQGLLFITVETGINVYATEP